MNGETQQIVKSFVDNINGACDKLLADLGIAVPAETPPDPPIDTNDGNGGDR